MSQTASPKPVKKGELVTITVSVTNPGPATAAADESQVEIFPLRGGSEHAAANPYQSVTASQGTCTITPTGAYQVADCAWATWRPVRAPRSSPCCRSTSR